MAGDEAFIRRNKAVAVQALVSCACREVVVCEFAGRVACASCALLLLGLCAFRWHRNDGLVHVDLDDSLPQIQ